MVIGEHSAARTSNDKTAMMFQMDDRPGALAEALGIFKRNRVNLTWIESFPIQNTQRAYLFFEERKGAERTTYQVPGTKYDERRQYRQDKGAS